MFPYDPARHIACQARFLRGNTTMGRRGARLKEIFISALRARLERSRALRDTAFSLLAIERRLDFDAEGD
jgi:hypothetical protein